ncbi:DUF6766 family protein [Sinomonas mesophila]|uniref:DUF6766 family protein n=1 Tax=Sinomonas mesophila TaxID=1531955 RepID=UPI000985156C|nr:DUF6766 family protein [Sinomonas mesophila]
MKRFLKNNGLLLANLALFLVFLSAMAVSGWHQYNEEQVAHGQAVESLWGYVGTGAFIEAVFENWESEFLQVGMYVVLTAYLYQRGSSESKPLGKEAKQDQDPRTAEVNPDTPWPVRRGGWVLAVYEHSLSTLFLVLFTLSFILHAIGGAETYSEEQTAHGQPAVTVWEYLGTSRFWFESFQNWQSEFLAVGVIVGASVFLRERRSAESKPVAEPHYFTGA